MPVGEERLRPRDMLWLQRSFLVQCDIVTLTNSVAHRMSGQIYFKEVAGASHLNMIVLISKAVNKQMLG